MSAKLPYLATPGTIDNAIAKIKAAATPPTFNNDFVHAKLQIKGGAGKALPPFFKKLGLVAENGSPTKLYKQLRNQATTGAAIAQALKIGYRPLYEINEYCHEVSDKELKGLILQVTGLEEDNASAKQMQSTFSRLKKYANFEDKLIVEGKEEGEEEGTPNEKGANKGGIGGINIGYNINLNLPATTNVEVFDAIFQSLRRNLLRDE